jgi:hypothetical protein
LLRYAFHVFQSGIQALDFAVSIFGSRLPLRRVCSGGVGVRLGQEQLLRFVLQLRSSLPYKNFNGTLAHLLLQRLYLAPELRIERVADDACEPRAFALHSYGQ